MLMGNFILLPTKKEKQGAELMQPKEITYAQCDRNQDFRNDILIRGRGQVYQKHNKPKERPNLMDACLIY